MAGFALYEHKLTETREGEGVLRVLVSELSDDFENRYSLLFAELSFFGESSSDLGFGEGFGHSVYLLGCSIAVLFSSELSAENQRKIKVFLTYPNLTHTCLKSFSNQGRVR